jgi:Transposase IS66 family
LIHLLRDMNQDILNNPFDEELQSVTGPFGALLRDIVTTIDQHGLKRCHLKKHDRGVARFFESLVGQSFRSEAAEALRQRLLKNRDKLFTFIQHDGVPWNNNSAENAIKRFAYYREDTVGVMKEAGLADYLVLLSLCHTCRYRGLSFLKFLLSRERDLDAFGTPGRAKRRRPVIEVYPKGFVPPHLARLRNKAPHKSGGPPEQIAEAGSELDISPRQAPSTATPGQVGGDGRM